jgi:predicted ester cyclase
MDTPNKLLVRRYLEEVVNTGNIERVAEFIVSHDIDTAKQHIRGVRATYPDLHVTVVCQIAEGELVASRVVGRGTHKGEWRGIRPTDKRIVIDAVNIDRVVDGKIAEHWGVANDFEALFKLEAFSPPPGRMTV